MDSQNLKQRIRDEPNEAAAKKKNYNGNRTKRDKKMAMAKRGLRSLAVAVSLPLSLTVLDIYFFGSKNGYGVSSKPFWFPPMWALHLMCVASSFLMGLAAWLVWAEGGFHTKPTGLSFYLAQMLLGLAWDPIVFRAGASRIGLVVSLGMFGALVGCSKVFREVNPIAGDLVKPCLAWVAFLAIVSLTLVFL